MSKVTKSVSLNKNGSTTYTTTNTKSDGSGKSWSTTYSGRPGFFGPSGSRVADSRSTFGPKRK